MKNGKITLTAVVCALSFGVPGYAATYSATNANFTNSTGGQETVSASAAFAMDNNGNLVITLHNTGGTVDKASLLTGIVFNVNGSSADATLTSATLTDGSKLYSSATGYSTPTTDLSAAKTQGGYQMVNDPFTLKGNSYHYGVATIGGGVWSGRQVGNDNYGIVSSNTDLNDSQWNNQFPYVDDSLTIVIQGFSASDLAKVADVGFVYGSNPDGVVSATQMPSSIPEPGSLALLGTMTTMGGAFTWRRRGVRRKRA